MQNSPIHRGRAWLAWTGAVVIGGLAVAVAAVAVADNPPFTTTALIVTGFVISVFAQGHPPLLATDREIRYRQTRIEDVAREYVIPLTVVFTLIYAGYRWYQDGAWAALGVLALAAFADLTIAWLIRTVRYRLAVRRGRRSTPAATAMLETDTHDTEGDR